MSRSEDDEWMGEGKKETTRETIKGDRQERETERETERERVVCFLFLSFSLCVLFLVRFNKERYVY